MNHGQSSARLTSPATIGLRAMLAGEDDELPTVAPLRALIPDFAALLAMPTDATTTQIERAPTIGRPLGRPEWIAALERRLGRPLAAGKPGQSVLSRKIGAMRHGCGKLSAGCASS
jgi:hypothetical protein